jgi:hypothetical protein
MLNGYMDLQNVLEDLVILHDLQYATEDSAICTGLTDYKWELHIITETFSFS